MMQLADPQQLAMYGGYEDINEEQDEEEEEYISEDEFLNQLSDQEKEIFNALVNSIFQAHLRESINFQKRRIEYIKNSSKNKKDISQEERLMADLYERNKSILLMFTGEKVEVASKIKDDTTGNQD